MASLYGRTNYQPDELILKHLSTPNPRPRRHLLAVQQVLAVVAFLMMLTGQSTAVGAFQTQNGAWIEICTGDGIKLMRTGDGPTPDTCAHCDLCNIQFTTTYTGSFDLNLIGPAPEFTPLQHIFVNVVIRAGAEQYWASNRGPPLASKETMKTKFAVMATQRTAMTTPMQRGFTWL